MSFLEGLFKDVTYSFNERIRNPYWFSLLVIFIYYNWGSLYFLLENLFVGADVGVAKIKALKFSIWQPFLLAFVGVIVFYIVQYFGLIITVIFQDRIKPTILEKFSHKRIAPADKVIGLRSLITQFSEEKNELENQISSLKSSYESKISDASSEMIVKDNDLKNLKEEIDKCNAESISLEKEKNESLEKVRSLEEELKAFKEENEKMDKERISLIKKVDRLSKDLNQKRGAGENKSSKELLKTRLAEFIRFYILDSKADVSEVVIENIIELSDDIIDPVGFEAVNNDDFIKDYSTRIREAIEQAIGKFIYQTSFESYIRIKWLSV